MTYSDFKTLKKVVENFNLKIVNTNLFDKGITPIIPEDWLIRSLSIAQSMGFKTEKERSERLVSPILSQIATNNNYEITIYSGHELNVDTKRGLKGKCDFLLAHGRKSIMLLEGPLFSIVEAKRENLEYGTAQCAAQLIGAQLYNKNDGLDFPYLYGATTDGLVWQFLKLEDKTLTIHEKSFTFSELNIILGAIQYCFDDCKKFL